MKYIIAILLIYFYIDRRPIRIARRNKRKEKRATGNGFKTSFDRMMGF